MSEAHAARIAVIVPCYEDGPLVGETLASIQENEPLEVVVVDDGSTDQATAAKMDELEAAGTTVVRHSTNMGVAAARNTGLRHSRAPYVLPLDADDLLVPGMAGRLADLLDAAPQAAVAYGDYEEFGESRALRPVPATIDPFRLAYINEYPQTALLRRSALESVGNWDERKVEGYAYEDWDLWLGLARQGAQGVHAGADVITHRQRVHGPRLLEDVKRHHVPIYRELRKKHADLFDRLGEHRRHTNLSPTRRRLYPVLFGGRRRYAFEVKVKEAIEQVGLWRRPR